MRQYPPRKKANIPDFKKFTPEINLSELRKMQIGMGLNGILTIALLLLATMLLISFIAMTIMKHGTSGKQQNLHKQNTVKAITTEEAKTVTAGQAKPAINEIAAGYNGSTPTAGDVLDPSLIVLHIKYNNGTENTITANKLTLTPKINEPLSAGNNTFTIEYNGMECALIVNTENPNLIANAKIQYQDEYDKADYKFDSDRLFITITRQENPDIYWIAHVITAPDNIPKTVMCGEIPGELSTMQANETQEGWILAVNGSYYDDNGNLCDGLYINNSTLLMGTETTGNELCVCADGKLYTPEPGESYNNLMAKNVTGTILSENPTILQNGQTIHIEPREKKLCKTVIGMVRPCEYYIIVTGDGNYTSNVSYDNISGILQDKGCTYAKAVSSAANVNMMLEGQMINNPAEPNRNLTDMLSFY